MDIYFFDLRTKKQKLAKNGTKFKEKFEYLKTLLHLFYIFKKKIHDAIPGNPRNAYDHDTQRIKPENYFIFEYLYIKYIKSYL